MCPNKYHFGRLRADCRRRRLVLAVGSLCLRLLRHGRWPRRGRLARHRAQHNGDVDGEPQRHAGHERRATAHLRRPPAADRAIAAPPQPAVAAAMRDDGNFVLYAANATMVWSTFAAPTDTLLADQDLAPGAQLFSSVSATSRATGKYRLSNQLNDGNLVMYPVGTMNVAAAGYWDTGTFQIGFPLTLRLDASGVLYLVGNNGSYTKNLTRPSAAQAGEKAHYHRVTLDPDGVLRSYRHGLLSSGE
ncbi:hypothetical protein E2562_028019 [Oryza meyeriana var. granulata]|uniref:non-specific serine/threonine protein kinase n=1 Tax=Oryza meyeriana var. granulata TaxID=110450 RepID=A0A6G1BZ31_9ORYZ|nr:hypothetical protein E2562_028019 [Oryza meyeriana var. granulata]